MDLAPKCELLQVENLRDVVKITQSNFIYFFKDKEFINILCKNYTKPMELVGSGSLQIPSGCKVKYRGVESFSLSHVKINSKAGINLDNSVYYQNFKKILHLFEISNKSNESFRNLDITSEEKIIEDGFEEVNGLMDSFQFSQNAIHVTLWALISYAFLGSVFMITLVVCLCRPDKVVICKKCCCPCGYKKPKGQELELDDF